MNGNLEILNGVNLKRLRQWLDNVNGHRILPPVFFRRMCFSPDFLQKATKWHRTSPEDFSRRTGFLFEGGMPEKIRGVSDLDFVRLLARQLRADVCEADEVRDSEQAARLYAAACCEVLGDLGGAS